MLRRDITKALFLSTATALAVAPEAHAQTCAGAATPNYPQTQAETTAGIVPSCTGYPPGDVRRYGADPTGQADSTSAFSSLLDVLLYGDGGVGLVPSGTYLVTSTVTTSLTPSSGPSSASHGITLSAYGAVVNYTGTGYAFDFYSPNTSADFYHPQLRIEGLNIDATGSAAGGIRINDLSTASFVDVYVQGASSGSAFTIQNTVAWSENNRFVGCGAIGCQTGMSFVVSGSGQSSFARTYVEHFFGALNNTSDYWFYVGPGAAVYDSEFIHIAGNFESLAYFATAGDMSGTVIDGIHAELASLRSSQSAIRLLNYPDTSGVSRRPVVLNLGPYAVWSSGGVIPVWADGSGNAITGPESAQEQPFHSATGVAVDGGLLSVQGGGLHLGSSSAVSGSIANCAVGTWYTITHADQSFAFAVGILTVSTKENDGPKATYMVAKSGSYGYPVVTSLVSVSSSKSQALEIQWGYDPTKNPLQVQLSGGSGPKTIYFQFVGLS